ncbi:hypothetical protein PS9374_04410 [Planomonospora sphaerica]|uniref:Uncharacterized protein n=1 Tax=Planomonospora sphaerica TaxID=161355 RepID=A0A161LMU9_9ACTN|nr:hypothetical protein [Planomonospora sphaerica]GAT68745.1 hypothetical protein PS9374_04410 [Planomonospora sphaerica]
MNKLPERHLRRLVARAAIFRVEADRDAAQLDDTPRWRLRRRHGLRQQAHDSAIKASTARHMLCMALAADCFDQQTVEDDADRMIHDYIAWDGMQQAGTYLMLGLHRS